MKIFYNFSVSNSDKDNELAVGTIDGDLMIFKGDQKKPWRVCSNLGSVIFVIIYKLL